MKRPGYENKLNWNTVLLAIGILVTGVGWGISWQNQKNTGEANAAAIVDNTERIRALETDNRELANIKFRVDLLESGASNAASSQRDLERAVSEMAADLRVTREIVERLDQSLNGNRRSPSGSFPR